MSHLDDGLIQELVDGEISSRDLPPIQAHLAGCAVCRARLDAARGMAGEVDELLTLLDEPAPVASAAGAKQPPSRKPFPVERLAWAASLILAVGIGYASRGQMTEDRGQRTEVGEQLTANGEQSSAQSEEIASAAVQPRNDGGQQAAPPPQAAPRGAAKRADALPPVPAAVATEDRPVSTPREVAGVRDQVVVDRFAAAPPATQAVAPLAVARSARDEVAAVTYGGVPARAMVASERVASLEENERRRLGIREVDLPTAMTILGGTIRLIDGMVPERIDAMADTVTVVYATSYGAVRLVQRLEGEELVWHLFGSAMVPADSFRVWRERVGKP